MTAIGEVLSSWLRYLPELLAGLRLSVTLTLVSMALGLLCGFVAAVARGSGSRLARAPFDLYVSFFRGTPLLVQIFLVYYGLPQFGITLDPVPSAIVVFTLNAGAYLSETIRGAFFAVPHGQREAALSTGLSPGQMLWYVVVPQALRVAIPPIGNTFVSLLKDTSLAAVITIVELMRAGMLIYARTFDPFTVLIEVALIYWVVTVLIVRGLRAYERRLGKAYAR
ncbi:MAG TPA: amino acid ABC transporter permease [Thermodesulfobacteriota bacterium]